MHILEISSGLSRWFAVRIPAEDDEPASVIHSLLSVEDVIEFFGGEEIEMLPVLDSPGVVLVYPCFSAEPEYAGAVNVSRDRVNMRATMVLDFYRSMQSVTGGPELFSVLCGPVLLSGVTSHGSLASLDGEELTRVIHLLHPVD